jgi:hypothetical protein
MGDRRRWSPTFPAEAQATEVGVQGPLPSMPPGTPFLSHLHGPRWDGGAIPARAAQGGHAGHRFFGEQVPACIVAQVACGIRWVQDDGSEMPQGESCSW